MERQRKERLVGAAVLIMLAVIFIPMILDNSVQPESGISGTNIPPQPEGEFESRVIPIASPGADGRGPDSSIKAQGAPPATEPAATPVAVDTSAEATAPPAAASAPPVAEPEAPAGAVSSPSVPPPADAGKSQAVGVPAWVVQLGSFASAENAETLNKKLRQSGYSSFVEPLQQGAVKVYRVRVGPELRRTSAQSVRDRLQKNMGLEGIVVPYP